MRRRLVIVGAGFAGLQAALAAARLRAARNVAAEALKIAVVAPEPTLVIQPRLYEPDPHTLTAPLGPLLEAVEVTYVQGLVECIDASARSLEVVDRDGRRRALPWDRLMLASGSRLYRPLIPGLAEHAFSIDQLEDAVRLDHHLHGLAERPSSSARDTIVVAGGGFTGIEAAAEMPARLRAILGAGQAIRIVLVERSPKVAPDMGPGPRPVIETALRDLGVEIRAGVDVAALDAAGVTLSDGQRIDSTTAIWTAGLSAAPLAAQIAGEHDALGRLGARPDSSGGLG